MTFKLTEIAQTLMDRNGMFVLGTFDELEWNFSRFWRVMYEEIKRYQGYVPLTKKFNINVQSGLAYDFTHDPNNVGYNAEEDIAGEPPKWISNVIPVNSLTLLSTLAGLQAPFTRQTYSPSRLVEPRPFLFDYRNHEPDYTKPKRMVLTLSEIGIFDIIAHYDYELKVTTSSPNVVTEVEIPEIHKDLNYHILIDLLSGRFLMAIGKSRRAFTYNEMPIGTDAAVLVEEGQREYETALAALYTDHNWWESMRP